VPGRSGQAVSNFDQSSRKSPVGHTRGHAAVRIYQTPTPDPSDRPPAPASESQRLSARPQQKNRGRPSIIRLSTACDTAVRISDRRYPHQQRPRPAARHSFSRILADSAAAAYTSQQFLYIRQIVSRRRRENIVGDMEYNSILDLCYAMWAELETSKSIHLLNAVVNFSPLCLMLKHSKRTTKYFIFDCNYSYVAPAVLNSVYRLKVDLNNRHEFSRYRYFLDELQNQEVDTANNQTNKSCSLNTF